MNTAAIRVADDDVINTTMNNFMSRDYDQSEINRTE